MECRIYGGWVKTHLQFEAVCGPKFMSFWDDVEDPSQFAKHLPAYVYRVSFWRYRALNLPLSCKVVQKRWFWGPRFVGEGIPTFQTCIFKSHLLPTMWPDMAEFRSASFAGSWRIKKKKESVVKHKSADNYVGRPSLITVHCRTYTKFSVTNAV